METNFLGLDFGQKRVGVAIALGGILASAIEIFSNDESLFLKIGQLVEEEKINIIVVGLPISMDGSSSPQTQKTLEFIKLLGQKFPQIKIEKQDERLSSVEARKNLANPLFLVDAESARIILQAYLDSLNRKR